MKLLNVSFKPSLSTCRSVLATCLILAQGVCAQADYRSTVLAGEPVAYWSFDAEGQAAFANQAGDKRFNGVVKGKVTSGQPGPRQKQYPDFSAGNNGITLGGKGDFLRIKDPGDESPLDFGKGDSITIEAWVRPVGLGNGRNVYILGKGRTHNKGFGNSNQNYALRLWNRGGSGGQLSFLFRKEGTASGGDQNNWHRWTSHDAVPSDGIWSHVAVTYTFGKADSVRGYINGEEVKGSWDYGGKTSDAPVVDNDELWIGSSLGGSPNSSFKGGLDEVAIFRKIVPAKEIAKRFRFNGPSLLVDRETLPKGKVLLEIVENVKAGGSWSFFPGDSTESFELDAFAVPFLPRKYNSKGLISDRSNEFLVRASSVVTLPKGELTFLIRSRSGSRLIVDGKVVGKNPFLRKRTNAHEDVPELHSVVPKGVRHLHLGNYESQFEFSSKGGEHVVTLEAVVGGSGVRPEPGELLASLSNDGRMFHVLGPKQSFPLTDDAWTGYTRELADFFQRYEQEKRHKLDAAEREYWSKRHERAKVHIASLEPLKVPAVKGTKNVFNAIDRFIGAKLEENDLKAAGLVDDASFVRRVTLDLIGVPPSPAQLDSFNKDRSPQRRANYIDQLLQHPGWADHWVGYWQDVLAENPGVLKPMLNNSGPFRFYLHEAFLDNRPMDRFVTDLVMMEGSKYYGGPAGFSMATQNDVPYAAKANIVGSAFMGMNMACARCHDAPYHDFKQQDLFSLAAMLKRSEQAVPKSSSIPQEANIIVGRLVEVTLKPGAKVKGDWPFHDIVPVDLEKGVLRRQGDTREQLAALITDPRNERFAQVMANRVWKRYMGWGLVESADDWENPKPSHPELLAYLGRYFVSHGYDLKKLARLILSSHAYQREVGIAESRVPSHRKRFFEAQVRRRLTAEQVLDSLFAVAGKSIQSEQLNMDVDGRNSVTTFMNLGDPDRAWEFTSLSNERDRPALAMPKAQSVVDLLVQFGWREMRQNPATERETEPNVLQPAAVANGIIGSGRASRLSDDSAFTQMAIEAKSVDGLIEQTFQRILSRKPSAAELADIRPHIAPGFDKRKTNVDPDSVPRREKPHAVSWSNHLSAEATTIKMEMERLARAGDEPTVQLESDWRERMEDIVWTLINSPEFVFLP